MTALSSCLDEVKSWLSQKILSLNKEGIYPSENMKAFNFDLGSLSAFRSSQVRNLGVILDDSLKFDKQISTVTGLYSATISVAFANKKLLRATMKTYLGAPVQLTRSAYLC